MTGPASPSRDEELEALRRRITETEEALAEQSQRASELQHALEQSQSQLSEHERIQEELRESKMLLEGILEHCPAVIFAKDAQGRYLIWSRWFEALLGLDGSRIRDTTDLHIFPAESAENMRAEDEHILASGEIVRTERAATARREGAEPRRYSMVKFPLYDAGRPYAVCGIATDIEEIRRGEEERARLHDAVIQAHVAALRELSTPLIPIAEALVVMPLIGAIDTTRAGDVMQTLLAGIEEHRAEVAILDITGVPVVDAEVADSLIRAAQAALLLGTEVVLTGIRAAIARTLVELGAELKGIVTRSTLRGGIAYAMSRRSRLAWSRRNGQLAGTR